MTCAFLLYRLSSQLFPFFLNVKVYYQLKNTYIAQRGLFVNIHRNRARKRMSGEELQIFVKY